MSHLTEVATAPSLWRIPAVRRLLLVTLLGFSSFCLTLASLPSWAVLGGAPASTAGLVTTTMLAATVATQAAVPWLLTRFGIGRTLAVGLLLLGAPSPLLALSHDLEPLVAIAAVRGAGFAVLTVVGASLTATVAPPGRHGESVGVYGLAIAVPNLVGVPAGVALTQQGAFGWVALLAALPLVAVPLALRLDRDPAVAAPDHAQTASHGSAIVAVLAPSLVLLAVTLAGGGLLTVLPIARPTGALAAVALLLFGAMAALCRWRVGALADRMGGRLLLPVCLVTAVVGMSVVGAGLWARSDAAVMVGAVLFGAGYGAVQNLTLVVAFARVGPSRNATASSVWNAAFDAGTALGAGATGALAATGIGIPGAFVVSAAVMAVSLPLALLGSGRRRRRLTLP